MSFDNTKFTAWLADFESSLSDCGMPQRQILRYRTDYYKDAVAHYSAGRTADDAAVRELMG